MRIAVSGSHFTGKTTLIESLLKQLPNYTSVEEPYYLLEGEGRVFSHPPSVQDFEEQLHRSVRAIEESEENTIFDRCPLDFLAYAQAIGNGAIDVEEWVQKMEDALEQLDLIVYVPIENQIPVSRSEDLELRGRVDELLHEILLEDSLGLLEEIEVIVAMGSLENRAQKVKERL